MEKKKQTLHCVKCLGVFKVVIAMVIQAVFVHFSVF